MTDPEKLEYTMIQRMYVLALYLWEPRNRRRNNLIRSEIEVLMTLYLEMEYRDGAP